MTPETRHPPPAHVDGGSPLAARFGEVRAATVALCDPLGAEDMAAQSMPEASPAKWHLAHTSWFFETFVLARDPGYAPFHPAFGLLFNSYYRAVGERHPRPARGLLSRPTTGDVLRYRAHVDEHVERLLRRAPAPGVAATIELGLHHEQQHQELLLTDIKHLFSCNPLRPAYREGAGIDAPRDGARRAPGSAHDGRGAARWIRGPEGVQAIGHSGAGFAFDNESPRHRVFLEPYEIADRLVTCGELLDFIEDGGYRRPELWLDEGWETAQREGWTAPLYWSAEEGETDGRSASAEARAPAQASPGAAWRVFTLGGERPLDRDEPVRHVSFFEADACARWAGARLPTEAEWEAAVAADRASPARAAVSAAAATPPDAAPLVQVDTECWQWTASPYRPYPGYAPPAGALGEYNGKFMCNQFVLRGGSCATPRSHLRATYRNFFPPQARWQLSGFRLARDLR